MIKQLFSCNKKQKNIEKNELWRENVINLRLPRIARGQSRIYQKSRAETKRR